LIREGIALRKQNHDAAALEKFRQAHAIEPTARALAQIGLAEYALGKWVEASQHLREALEAKADQWIEKNRATLAQSLTKVDEHVGTLEILGGPGGATVSIDGVARGTLPLVRPLTVAIGTVTIELTAGGYAPMRRTTVIRAREMTREFFEAAPVTPAAGVATPAGPGPISTTGSAPGLAGADTEPASGSSRRMPLIIGAAGVAAVALVLGVVEHASWQGKVSSFESMGCGIDLPQRGGGNCSTLYDDGHRARTFAFVGYGAAAAFAGAAAVLYFTDPARSRKPARLACAIHAGSPGLACAVRF
jgi:hypothetical protein